jgi:antitoxin component HigA of HigAB toxin-antitoxin module
MLKVEEVERMFTNEKLQIRDEKQYEAAVEAAEALWDSKDAKSKMVLRMLMTAIETYENEGYE